MDDVEIKKAGKEFFTYILKMKREFHHICETSKSREELEYRLGEHHDGHKWHSFICRCKNLLRWRSEKQTKL